MTADEVLWLSARPLPWRPSSFRSRIQYSSSDGVLSPSVLERNVKGLRRTSRASYRVRSHLNQEPLHPHLKHKLLRPILLYLAAVTTVMMGRKMMGPVVIKEQLLLKLLNGLKSKGRGYRQGRIGRIVLVQRQWVSIYIPLLHHPEDQAGILLPDNRHH